MRKTSLLVAIAFVGQLVLGQLALADHNANHESNGGPPPKGDLDQCGNGPISAPLICTTANWQNGNLNDQQAHYVEGESVPYRLVLTNLPTTGTHTVEIEYDVKNGGKHAIDFLTSYDRTEGATSPCGAISPCVEGSSVAIPVPSSVGSPTAGQPTTSFNAIPSGERNLTIFNGSAAGTGLTYVSEGSLTDTDSATRMRLQFTANSSTVVLAWGGHIASSLDWGNGNAAGGISGSPYHMRFISLNGSGGNQDRSLSAGAVTAPPAPTQGTLTVIKKVVGSQALPSSFTLKLSINEAAPSTFQGADEPGTQTAIDIGAGYSVTEDAVANYTTTYSGTGCSGTMTAEGATCTVTNTYNAPNEDPTTGTLTVIKTVVGSQAAPSTFTLSATGGNATPSSFSGDANGTAVTIDINGQYSVSEGTYANYTTTYSAGCSGTMTAEGATCTVTNTYNAPNEDPTQGTLTVVKVVINNDGGQAQVSSFPLFINSTTTTSGTPNSLPSGQYVVSETSSPDYVASFSGDCDVNGVVKVVDGVAKTCTITNDDKTPTPPGGGGSAPQTGTLIVVTKVINDDGGTALPSSFTMTVGDGISVSSTFGGFDTPGISFGYAPGAYVVNGSVNAAYTQAKSANCSGAMLAGQTITCVVTYDDIPTGGPTPEPPAEPPAPQPEPEAPVTPPAAPVPQVLGATDSDLPVTGMPAWILASVLLAAAPFLRRKNA